MYRVSRCVDGPKKRKLKGCSTWNYEVIDNLEKAVEMVKKWKQDGYYTMIEEVE